MATDDQGNTYSKVIMDAAASIPAIKAMVMAGKAASKVAETVKDMLDDDKIVPKKKPPPDIKPKPKPEPDVKIVPKKKPKQPKPTATKKNPYRLSSDRQPGIETANTRMPLRSRREMQGLRPFKEGKSLAKGGEVKKNKSNMITKRGWGASRKT